MEEFNDKKPYEISFVSADEEGAKRMGESLKRAGGEIIFESPLLRIPLAYPIEKREEAFFGYFHFNILPSEMAGLEKQLRVQPIVLRFLIITPPLMKSKEKHQYPARRKPSVAPTIEKKQPSHLSNEALEKQLKEILQ
ncbi:MAG: 30S ribosomal protein S6 [Candidatus Liptonbacteria bacterium]|nr:30S ribosomal protein S6 [Candidatus Liptonbacteria bacterium]